MLIEKAAKICGTTPEAVLAKGKKKQNVLARYFIMSILKKKYNWRETMEQFPNIVNHATIINGITKLENWVKYDPCIRLKYQLFLKSISYE